MLSVTDHIGRYNPITDSFTGEADDVAEFWCNPGMFVIMLWALIYECMYQL